MKTAIQNFNGKFNENYIAFARRWVSVFNS